MSALLSWAYLGVYPVIVYALGFALLGGPFILFSLGDFHSNLQCEDEMSRIT